MKITIATILLLTSCFLRAQDSIYMLDGSKTSGKVAEIGTSEVIILREGHREIIPRAGILLIEFPNGVVEILNQPARDLSIERASSQRTPPPAVNEILRQNLVSFNSLSLINADISCFYERINAKQEIGLGLMGAVNINQKATIYTPHIFVLSNGRKLYDLGCFINYYPRSLEKPRSFYIGLLFKYTALSFSSLSEDTVRSGNAVSVNVSYQPANGYQLASMLSMGRHYRIGQNFFVKTLFALGGFNLKGEYKKQFNYMYNRGNSPGTATVNRNLLLKWYFGLNAGIYF